MTQLGPIMRLGHLEANARRSKARGMGDDELLLQFAETIQAKGCNHPWESTMPSDRANYVGQTRKWLDFFEEDGIEEDLDIRLFHAATYPSAGRRFGITKRGHFCLVPRNAKKSDLICIPTGFKVPFVFRKDGDYFRNIGECFVRGIMHGEALEFDGVERVTFNII